MSQRIKLSLFSQMAVTMCLGSTLPTAATTPTPCLLLLLLPARDTTAQRVACTLQKEGGLTSRHMVRGGGVRRGGGEGKREEGKGCLEKGHETWGD